MKRLVLAAAVALTVGCGASWSADETRDTSDALRTELALERLCVSDAGCSPAQVVVVLEGVDCDLGSMLHRKAGIDLVDAGACK